MITVYSLKNLQLGGNVSPVRKSGIMGPGRYETTGGVDQDTRATTSFRCQGQEQRTEGFETNAPTPPDSALSGVADSDYPARRERILKQ